MGVTKMRKVIIAGIISTVLCAAVSCMAIEPNQPSVLTGSVVEGNNKFALELYQKLQCQQGNLFLSPYSISTALAMTYAGARGQTAEQMQKPLNFPVNEPFH